MKYGYTPVTTSVSVYWVESIILTMETVHFVLSKHVPADKIVVFNDNYVDLAYLRQPHFEPY